jgi:F420-dependent oxidoreductase-like protein
MDLGLHVANFTWEGGPQQLAPTLARIARGAEDGGFSRITVMDHVWQIHVIGPPEHEMLEGYTALGFLAASTERVLLHTLVTGVVYRDPGLLAKAVTTLDVLSGGRALLGIGAAWNEEESTGLGLPFPPIGERFERLEESLQICRQMWSGSEDPYEGRHYVLGRTLNSPQMLGRPRIMIGGGGERKTLALVASYADECNIFPGPEAAHKLDVLRSHCERVGRDYDEIVKTTMVRVEPRAESSSLLDELRRQHELGFTVSYATARGPQPLQTVEMLAAEVIPEISKW